MQGRRVEAMPRWDGLPQHWIRDTQPHDRWCSRCRRWVSKWHEHHSPERKGDTSVPQIVKKD